MLHRRRDHLAGELRAGGKRPEQQISRARAGAGTADPGMGLRLVDGAADVHRAAHRHVGAGAARAQGDAGRRRVLPVALLQRSLQLAQFHLASFVAVT